MNIAATGIRGKGDTRVIELKIIMVEIGSKKISYRIALAGSAPSLFIDAATRRTGQALPKTLEPRITQEENPKT